MGIAARQLRRRVCEALRRGVLPGAFAFLLVSCSSSDPRIEFTKVPPADKGGPDVMGVIAGRVAGAKPGQQIAVFSHSEVWWAEPRLARVLTEIRPDSTWETPTHLGTQYAAALVETEFKPPVTSETLPVQGKDVAA